MKVCSQCDTGYPESHTTCPTHGGVLSEIRDLRPGMLVRNTYRIVRKLGQGGMGAVYLAQHTLMDEPQALKFLSSELSQDEAFTSRFLREVRTLRQVRHKNVVDAGNLEPAEDGTLFFPMEFVDGPDLRHFLHQAPKPFDVGLALFITRGIAEGLGAAHAKGMVHRDIKPENILMARDGDTWVPKIADFGIVATRELSQHTQTGSLLLTPFYAAPEQWLGTRASELDGRTDLYALGGVLYEMLTGRKVFDAENYHGWAQQHLNALPQPPSDLRPDLANWPGLDALVLRLLAKNREQRPKDVAELIRLLDAVVFVSPSIMQPITEPESRGHETVERAAKRVPIWVWIGSVAILLVAAFAVTWLLKPQPQKPGQLSSLANSSTSSAPIADILTKDLPNKPTNSVMDFANVLSPEAIARLDQFCGQLSHSQANTQVEVVTIHTLNGTGVAVYSKELFNKWGIGSKGSDRGVLVLLAVNDHKWRIETGRGLERILTNSKAADIGQEMIPLLRANDFNGAATLAVDRIANVVAADAKMTLDDKLLRNSIHDESDPSSVPKAEKIAALAKYDPADPVPQDYFKRRRAQSFSSMSLTEKGKWVFVNLNCDECHNSRPDARGPILPGVYGSRLTLSRGGTVIVDDKYLRA